LEQALVLALIRQESGFYSAAVSPAGARGLMQLMPGTAKLVAKRLGVAYRKGDLTENPAYNLRLGRAYLAKMLERFDGSLILALAAYNAGPHRVDRWLRAHGDPRRPGVDPIHWAERIPFSETRNYVQRILESLVVYRHRLTGTQTPVQLTPIKLGALP
jgi:soluble lytic murein transglycosylase